MFDCYAVVRLRVPIFNKNRPSSNIVLTLDSVVSPRLSGIYLFLISALLIYVILLQAVEL